MGFLKIILSAQTLLFHNYWLDKILRKYLRKLAFCVHLALPSQFVLAKI